MRHRPPPGTVDYQPFIELTLILSHSRTLSLSHTHSFSLSHSLSRTLSQYFSLSAGTVDYQPFIERVKDAARGTEPAGSPLRGTEMAGNSQT